MARAAFVCFRYFVVSATNVEPFAIMDVTGEHIFAGSIEIIPKAVKKYKSMTID